MQQNDRLIQGMACSGDFRIIAAQTTQTIESARLRFDLSPVATDALGRSLTGAVLLARLLEKTVREQRVTLRFEGGGPLGTVLAEGTVSGSVRGFLANPQFAGGNTDVGEAIGFNGKLTVVRGTPPLGKPYTSQVELVSGEVAKDIAQFLLQSEQIASAVLLGVLNRRNGVSAAGGIVVQAFPHATEAAIAAIEKRIREAPPLSTLLEKMAIEEVLVELFRGLDYKKIDASFNVPIRYECTCTREKALFPLSLLTRDELQEMAQTEGGAEVVCQFCMKKYQFSRQELIALTREPQA